MGTVGKQPNDGSTTCEFDKIFCKPREKEGNYLLFSKTVASVWPTSSVLISMQPFCLSRIVKGHFFGMIIPIYFNLFV